MATIPEALAIAIQHHQAGRLAAAEQIYRGILAAEPNQADAWHLLGFIAHQAGRHEVAVQYIGRAIRLKGTDAAFHNNLGGAYFALRRIPQALACYRRALELKPDYAEARYNLGVALKDQGHLDEAIACYRRALELKPDFAEAHNNLGIALKHQEKPDEAIACYRRVLQLKPDYAEAHNNLGDVLEDQGKLDEAIACYRRARELKPDYAEAHNNLGAALNGRGNPHEAIACYRRALDLKPDFAETHYNLGNALKDQGHLDEAIACFRRALELKPDFAEVRNNLGTAFKERGNLDEAIACYHRAIELKPDHAEAYGNLGNALNDQRKPDEALACYRRALELKPDYAEPHYNLGNALKDQGKLDEAVACYRRALELKPDHTACLGALVNTLQHLCCWEDLNVLSRRVIEAVDRDAGGGIGPPVSPFTFFALPTATTAEQQLRCARQWVSRKLKPTRSGWETTRAIRDASVGNALRGVPRPVDEGCSESPERHGGRSLQAGVIRQPPSSEPGESLAPNRALGLNSKITVGYLSADLQSHATAWLIAELIEKHDRGRFAVFGYSYGPDDHSPTRRRLVSAFDRFVDVSGASFAETAARIAADGVGILVDLKGYTQNTRTEVLLLRPAPIQVNYLGYPGTMGAPFMDYVLVDDFVVPPEQQPLFTEKLVHLPGCYQVNDSRREISPHAPSRAECGLPEKGFVFCSFNNNYKVTAEMFDVWMRLLKSAAGSVLWLFQGNRFAPVNLRREAEARGVAAERLVFAPRWPLPEHLARHRLADLFLDTFPVNAHTTASDALWAGCPVLTLAGETFASRVAGSLLRTIGLPELVAQSLEDYEAIALRLARSAGVLASVRARLDAGRKTSGLFDGGQFARNLEKAYVTMWKIYASGGEPRAFAVSRGAGCQPARAD